ncbi:phage holin family protein [Actibacterium lipolyticum]|uniref:Holin-X, holin superfamily III n=1 Tax=Actibacterium lipolyticum TaxID=1524263 RepID=A0A238KJG8_9RHOB|nr:phage holin family protein [Actibacterium lipolyticum]SMX42933.1 hypothetical protein COL8621_02139 [Actibacterium lipolyticum]
MLSDLQQKAAQGARRAALGAAGVALISVGAGFLTVAAWLVLSALQDAQFAALVIGLSYLGVGSICLAMGKRAGTPPRSTIAPRAASSPAEEIAVAFLRGLRTGQEVRK